MDEAEKLYFANIEQKISEETEKLNQIKKVCFEKLDEKLAKIKEDSIYMSDEFFEMEYNKVLEEKQKFGELIDLEIELYKQYKNDQKNKDLESQYNAVKKETALIGSKLLF